MARKLMLARRMWDGAPLVDEVRRWYVEEGKSMRDIADTIGCTPAAVLGLLRKMGVETRQKHLPRGYKYNNPTRTEKLRKAFTGRKFTLIQRARMSEAASKRIREKHPRWRGGRKHRTDGYVMILLPDHPQANSEGYVMEHRLVMERQLGRVLDEQETVHHKNGVRDDNDPENLQLFATPNEHMAYHMTERWEKKRAQRDNFDREID